MQLRVSVIIPTIHQRKPFHDAIFDQYMKQDYHNKELIWDWEDGTIGAKRNRCCEKARGEIIITMDDDDMYAPDWISKSVEALLTSDADIVGLNQIYLYDLENKEGHQYTWNPDGWTGWLAGATLAYRRSFWEQNKFPNIQTSEDTVFVSRAKSVYAHGYKEGFLASIHPSNTSVREVNTGNYRRLGVEEERMLVDRWKL